MDKVTLFLSGAVDLGRFIDGDCPVAASSAEHFATANTTVSWALNPRPDANRPPTGKPVKPKKEILALEDIDREQPTRATPAERKSKLRCANRSNLAIARAARVTPPSALRSKHVGINVSGAWDCTLVVSAAKSSRKEASKAAAAKVVARKAAAKAAVSGEYSLPQHSCSTSNRCQAVASRPAVRICPQCWIMAAPPPQCTTIQVRRYLHKSVNTLRYQLQPLLFVKLRFPRQ